MAVTQKRWSRRELRLLLRALTCHAFPRLSLSSRSMASFLRRARPQMVIVYVWDNWRHSNDCASRRHCNWLHGRLLRVACVCMCVQYPYEIHTHTPFICMCRIVHIYTFIYVHKHTHVYSSSRLTCLYCENSWRRCYERAWNVTKLTGPFVDPWWGWQRTWKHHEAHP